MEKKLTIYHLSHVDLDGYGAQAIINACSSHYGFTHKLEYEGYDVKYFNSNYGEEILSKLEEIKTILKEHVKNKSGRAFVLITDLNLTEEAALFVEQEIIPIVGEENVRLLDHHASGLEVSKGRKWYHLDTTKSGTLLTYEFVEEMEFLVTDFMNEKFPFMVDAYDLWKKDKGYYFKTGKLITFYLGLISKLINSETYKNDNHDICRAFVRELSYKNNISEETVFKILTTVLKKHAKDKHKLVNHEDLDVGDFTMQDSVDSIIVNSVLEMFDKQLPYTGWIIDEVNYDGSKIAVIVTPSSLSSSVMNTVLEMRPEFKGIASVSYNGVISMRANGEYDVSKLAKALGGGGHVNAAGCKIENIKSEAWKIKRADRIGRIDQQQPTLEEIEKELEKFYLDYSLDMISEGMRNIKKLTEK